MDRAADAEIISLLQFQGFEDTPEWRILANDDEAPRTVRWQLTGHERMELTGAALAAYAR